MKVFLIFLFCFIIANYKSQKMNCNDINCIVMIYDVDMEGLQKLMTSEYLTQLTEKMNIKNDEMHVFTAMQQ